MKRAVHTEQVQVNGLLTSARRDGRAARRLRRRSSSRSGAASQHIAGSAPLLRSPFSFFDLQAFLRFCLFSSLSAWGEFELWVRAQRVGSGPARPWANVGLTHPAWRYFARCAVGQGTDVGRPVSDKGREGGRGGREGSGGSAWVLELEFEKLGGCWATRRQYQARPGPLSARAPSRLERGHPRQRRAMDSLRRGLHSHRSCAWSHLLLKFAIPLKKTLKFAICIFERKL